MRTFDVYQPAGTAAQGFFEQPLTEGAMTTIEKAGFHDDYFKERQTKDLLEVVVLNGGPSAIPRDPVAFEKLPLIEAEVLEPKDDGAKIILRSVTTLGEWARGAHTLGKDTLASLPEAARPSPQVLEDLKAGLRAKEGVVWVADAPPADKAAPSAVYLFKCDFDKRAIVLTSNGATSYLVKL